MANYSKIKTFDIANGKGIRTSIFFSGCDKHCKGCFNQETWDFNAGEPFTREVYETKIKPTITEHIAGLSCLGGEPLNILNVNSVLDLVSWFKKDFPNKNVWLWTGFKFEDLILYYSQHNSDFDYIKKIYEIFNYIDVLVDGQFIEEQKDLTLPWCGSRNQRVIDVQESFKQDKVVLYK